MRLVVFQLVCVETGTLQHRVVLKMVPYNTDCYRYPTTQIATGTLQHRLLPVPYNAV
jgi:hypothetical protein